MFLVKIVLLGWIEVGFNWKVGPPFPWKNETTFGRSKFALKRWIVNKVLTIGCDNHMSFILWTSCHIVTIVVFCSNGRRGNCSAIQTKKRDKWNNAYGTLNFALKWALICSSKWFTCGPRWGLRSLNGHFAVQSAVSKIKLCRLQRSPADGTLLWVFLRRCFLNVQQWFCLDCYCKTFHLPIRRFWPLNNSFDSESQLIESAKKRFSVFFLRILHSLHKV